MSKNTGLEYQDRYMRLGITIAALRRNKGMTQTELADKAKISRSHLSAIENPNEFYPFSLTALFGIADALGISPGDLLNTRVELITDKTDKDK